MGELRKLPNIAEKLEAQLTEVGIPTIDALKQTGSREAWLRIASIDPSACYMRLCSLEGAIQGVRWHNLDDVTKKEMKAFYDLNKHDTSLKV
jgi:DNA transformation protein